MQIRTVLVSAALLALTLVPTAHAGPIRAQFAYSFSATQTSTWSYDNGLAPSDCGTAPAQGGGTQTARYADKGKTEVTTDLSRNKRKAGFTITTNHGKGTFTRAGGFVIRTSQVACTESSDRVADTTRCGTQSSPLLLELFAFRSKLTVRGRSKPFDSDQGVVCPYFFFNGYPRLGDFSSFSDQARSDDSDLDQGGLLSTTQTISGAKLFKKKTVVLTGSRTQKYAPSTDTRRGLVGQTKINWKLTLKPR